MDGVYGPQPNQQRNGHPPVKLPNPGEPGCQNCGGTLETSPSEWFCKHDCQEKWYSKQNEGEAA